MNYLITGGTGFLGSYVCKRLIDGGHNVVCYDYIPNGNSIQQVLNEDEMRRVKLVRGDIADYINLSRTCAESKIDIIIHLAALLQSDSEANIPVAVDTNIKGTVNVFEVARLLHIKRVVWASSNSVYGSASDFGGQTLTSDSPHFPNCLYGHFKNFNEYLGAFYNEKYGLETVALRLCVLYGMARMRGGSNWIKELINEPALGNASKVPFGDMVTNVVYIKDAAHAVTLACDAPSEKLTRSAYTICGTQTSLAEMKVCVLKCLPNADITLLPGVNDVAPYYFDCTVEAQDLGYVPEYTTEMGVYETINAVRAASNLPPV